MLDRRSFCCCPNFPLIPGRFAHHSRNDWGTMQTRQVELSSISKASPTRKSMRHHQERKLLPAPPPSPLSLLERESQRFRRFFFLCHNVRTYYLLSNSSSFPRRIATRTWWPQLSWHTLHERARSQCVSKGILFGLLIWLSIAFVSECIDAAGQLFVDTLVCWLSIG